MRRLRRFLLLVLLSGLALFAGTLESQEAIPQSNVPGEVVAIDARGFYRQTELVVKASVRGWLWQVFTEAWGWSEGAQVADSLGAWDLISKAIPWAGPGRLFIPSGSQIFFQAGNTVGLWDGHVELYNEPGLGYHEVLTVDTELGEIAPLPSGHFLVPERSGDASGVRLIEFNQTRRVREYTFPHLVDWRTGQVLGARHIEVLRDGCTVLYTNGFDGYLNRVGRWNLCTDTAEPDFASLPFAQYAGSIRQLPDGDVLVANGTFIRRFAEDGSPRGAIPAEDIDARFLALSSDGTRMWAVGIVDEVPVVIPFNAKTGMRLVGPLAFEAPHNSLEPFIEIQDVVVVGEWRAAAPRITGKRRSSR